MTGSVQWSTCRASGRSRVRLAVSTGEACTEMTWSTTRPDVLDQIISRISDVLDADQPATGSSATVDALVAALECAEVRP